MAPQINDRWLWLGTTIFFLLAAHGIRLAIHDLISLIEIDPAQYPSSRSSSSSPENHSPNSKSQLRPEPEDSISLSTLRTLATSPNPNIANSAISLIISRFARDSDAVSQMQAEFFSSDPLIRKRARAAVKFIRECPALQALDLGFDGQHVYGHAEAAELPFDDLRGNWMPDGGERFHDDAGGFWTAATGDGGDGGVMVLSTPESLPDLEMAGTGNVEIMPVGQDLGWVEIPRARPVGRDGGEEEDLPESLRRRNTMVGRLFDD